MLDTFRDDTFGYDRKLNEVRNSDLLAFHNAGAYCSSMASQYNSRVRPAEILIENNTPYLIPERENIEDLVREELSITDSITSFQ